LQGAKLKEHDSDVRSCCLQELIEAQTHRTPDSPAIIAGDTLITYLELNERANILARCLMDKGIGPESLVGIYMDKSPEMLISMIGVLKSGAAFAPLDAARPVDQLARLPLSALICDRTAPQDVIGCGNPVLWLDDVSHGETGPEGNLPPVARPQNLAYVIFTSGSTGSPKGVAVEHRSIVASTRARLRMYPRSHAFLLLSSTSFDSAFAGIFGTLSGGGALVLPCPGTESDSREMARLIAHVRIDALLAIPSLLNLILDSAGANELDSLRTVIVAGERCSPGIVSRCRETMPQAEFVNEYGPTECTVWSTAWRAPATWSGSQRSVPIGMPVDDARIHLLSPDGEPVPDGQIGEICIAGPTVARGYVGRPDLTAAAFVPEPGGPPGSRMYRSGDLGRHGPDGGLEFVGRADRQLKISGFRVEPDEVEMALLDVALVREAAVLESPRSPGLALAAVISGGPPDHAEIIAQLRRRLPDYMVPSEVRSINTMPRTPNGKVDYQALAHQLNSDVAAAHDPPRSVTERAVARLWSDVLGRDGISRSDSFTEIGGSLEAVRIALHMSQIFGTEVPLLWVYESTTISEFAAWLESSGDNVQEIAAKWLNKRDAMVPGGQLHERHVT
jgi:amino acid adenylation domain-containing protein